MLSLKSTKLMLVWLVQRDTLTLTGGSLDSTYTSFSKVRNLSSFLRTSSFISGPSKGSEKKKGREEKKGEKIDVSQIVSFF